MRTVEVESVERDVPGRDGDLAALIAAYEAIARGSGGGRTVFVSGDAGSGRTELLRMLAAAARRADPPATVLAGGFHDGRFVGMGTRTGRRRRRSCGSSRASSRSPR